MLDRALVDVEASDNRKAAWMQIVTLIILVWIAQDISTSTTVKQENLPACEAASYNINHELEMRPDIMGYKTYCVIDNVEMKGKASWTTVVLA